MSAHGRRLPQSDDVPDEIATEDTTYHAYPQSQAPPSQQQQADYHTIPICDLDANIPLSLGTEHIPYSDELVFDGIANNWNVTGSDWTTAGTWAADPNAFSETQFDFGGSLPNLQPTNIESEMSSGFEPQAIIPGGVPFSNQLPEQFIFSGYPSHANVNDAPQPLEQPQSLDPIVVYENGTGPVASSAANVSVSMATRAPNPSKRTRPSASPEVQVLTLRNANAKEPTVPRSAAHQKRAKTSSKSQTRDLKINPDIDFSTLQTGQMSKHVPVKTSKNKAKLSQSKSQSRRIGRSGPLDVALKEKIVEVRVLGACWRCRRYKKPCSAGAGICDNCSTSGMRLWPSSFGCRRGGWTEHVMIILPSKAENTLRIFPQIELIKPPSWRKAPMIYLRDVPNLELVKTGDKWNSLSAKVLCMQIFGSEFIDLLKIMSHYQRNRKKEDNLLNLTASMISYTCDVYHAFVTVKNTAMPPDDVLSTITQIRACYIKTYNALLQRCLAGQSSSWIVAFLCVAACICSLIVFTDAIMATPAPLRAQLWPNTLVLIKDLRDNLYSDVVELLIVLAKGMKPLSFKCWTTVTEVRIDGSIVRVRHPEGLRLVSGDEGAFDAMMMLQDWTERYRPLLDTDVWLANKPHEIDVHPISALSALVAKVGGAYR